MIFFFGFAVSSIPQCPPPYGKTKYFTAKTKYLTAKANTHGKTKAIYLFILPCLLFVIQFFIFLKNSSLVKHL